MKSLAVVLSLVHVFSTVPMAWGDALPSSGCEDGIAGSEPALELVEKIKVQVKEALQALVSDGQSGNSHGAILQSAFKEAEGSDKRTRKLGEISSLKDLGTWKFKEAQEGGSLEQNHHIIAIDTEDGRHFAMRLAEWKQDEKQMLKMVSITEVISAARAADGFIGQSTDFSPLFALEGKSELADSLFFEIVGHRESGTVAVIRLFKNGRQQSEAPIELDLITSPHSQVLFNGHTQISTQKHLKFKMEWDPKSRAISLEITELTGPKMMAGSSIQKLKFKAR